MLYHYLIRQPKRLCGACRQRVTWKIDILDALLESKTMSIELNRNKFSWKLSLKMPKKKIAQSNSITILRRGENVVRQLCKIKAVKSPWFRVWFNKADDARKWAAPAKLCIHTD